MSSLSLPPPPPHTSPDAHPVPSAAEFSFSPATTIPPPPSLPACGVSTPCHTWPPTAPLRFVLCRASRVHGERRVDDCDPSREPFSSSSLLLLSFLSDAHIFLLTPPLLSFSTCTTALGLINVNLYTKYLYPNWLERGIKYMHMHQMVRLFLYKGLLICWDSNNFVPSVASFLVSYTTAHNSTMEIVTVTDFASHDINHWCWWCFFSCEIVLRSSASLMAAANEGDGLPMMKLLLQMVESRSISYPKATGNLCSNNYLGA